MSLHPEQESPKWQLNIPLTPYKICTSSRFWYMPPPMIFVKYGVEISLVFNTPVFVLSFIPYIRAYQSSIMLASTSITSVLVGASAEWRAGSADLATPMCTMFHVAFMALMKYKFEQLPSFATKDSTWYLYVYLFWWYSLCGAWGTGNESSGPYRSPVGISVALFDNLIFGGYQRLISVVRRDHEGSPKRRNYWTLTAIMLALHGFAAFKGVKKLYRLYCG